jgi:hypothetical protein
MEPASKLAEQGCHGSTDVLAAESSSSFRISETKTSQPKGSKGEKSDWVAEKAPTASAKQQEKKILQGR